MSRKYYYYPKFKTPVIGYNASGLWYRRESAAEIKGGPGREEPSNYDWEKIAHLTSESLDLKSEEPIKPDAVPEVPQRSALPTKATMGDFCFRVANKTFYVPAKLVFGFGKLSEYHWRYRDVYTARGRFKLRDFRESLRLRGEPGRNYIVLHSASTSYAWAVDEILGFLPTR